MKKKLKIKISDERHNQDLESLGSIFMPIMKDAFSSEDFVETDIMLNWVNIVGEDISLYCTPTSIKYNLKSNQRIINVEVPIGGFALELQHKEQYILDKINAFLGYKGVHKLSITQNANKVIKNKHIKKENTKNKLNREDKEYIEELSNGIKDDKLKEILIKLGENVIIENKEHKKNNGSY